ncbi:uncharacterized protein LOC119373475 [Rhipicephalus sanguineus]|uniref:uncharacterized protein LOC119373475 n=1 Tax=Rhipicephalus sanguineus TaxID=34632 RepID=UPI0020C3257B|nr:uncharacterized protein LOC119373475 [Rhipicephalus sanguineus]
MGVFQRGVSIYTSINDTYMQCATSRRTYLDLELKKASYVWELKGHGGSVKSNATFNLEEGEAVDTLNYYIDNDRTHVYTCHFFYTDYNTCVVLEMSFQGHNQCTLWVKPAVVDHVPGHCRKNYKKKCSVRFPTYDREQCKVN